MSPARHGITSISIVWIVLACLVLAVTGYALVRYALPEGPQSVKDVGETPFPEPNVGDDCTGPGDASCPKGTRCIERCGPPVAREDDPPPGWYCERDEIADRPRTCPICLASDVTIATPDGPTRVQDVLVGTRVWTIDASGEKVAAEVLQVSRMAAPASHQVVRLILSDGRETRVSPEHPTIDGRRVGDLQAGDAYDGAVVRSAELEAYGDGVTYDLLPEGIGAYWADGILMGSTLNPYR